MKNRYSFQSLFPVKEITYSTPPYMTIRRNDIEVLHLPVRACKLMDLIKKFDPNDISYIDDSSFNERFQNEDISTVRDSSSRYFVIDGENVWAKHLEGINTQLKAKFKLFFQYMRSTNKPVISLQVQNQDLYLSYKPSADRQLKVLPLGQRSLDPENPDMKNFFFNIIRVNHMKYSFEPVQQPGWFISTSSKSKSRVTVVPASDKTHYTVFAFDPTFNTSLSKVFRPNTEETFEDDTLYYGYNDRLFQNRYQNILAGHNYIMELDRLYRWPRQDNHYQRSYRAWQYKGLTLIAEMKGQRGSAKHCHFFSCDCVCSPESETGIQTIPRLETSPQPPKYTGIIHLLGFAWNILPIPCPFQPTNFRIDCKNTQYTASPLLPYSLAGEGLTFYGILTCLDNGNPLTPALTIVHYILHIELLPYKRTEPSQAEHVQYISVNQMLSFFWMSPPP